MLRAVGVVLVKIVIHSPTPLERASFIGLEAAASLRARGLEVHVVAPEAVPLQRVLGHEVGTFVRAIHEDHGVKFHLSLMAERFDGSELHLSDGSRIAADFIVLGVGVKPNTKLASDAALDVDNGVLVAIGGGSFTVPFLSWCNVPVRKAIGTSAAVGFPIALGGAVGYIWNGWGVGGLPAASLGFVYLPAMVGVAAVSVLTAPIGARLTHQLPVKTLKRVFAAILLALAGKMMWGLL